MPDNVKISFFAGPTNGIVVVCPWIYTAIRHQRFDNIPMAMLDSDGIETRPVFYPMHTLPPYQEDRSYPVADLWSQRGLNLPTHLELSRSDIQRVAHPYQQVHKLLVGFHADDYVPALVI